MTAYLIVFLGAGVGGCMRHGVNIGCARLLSVEFPWGTLTVNVLGSLAMGLLAGWFATRLSSEGAQHARLLLMTGVLGGFTTFSAYSLDAVLLWERGQIAAAAIYVLGSVVLCLAALVGGLALGRALS